jgi:AraC family transcriptional activator of pobA
MALRIQILQIQEVTQGDPLNKPYRDNGYVLLFQREGYLRLMVDHDLAELKGCSVYFILPGQLRHHLIATGTDSWMITIDPAWLQNTVLSKLNEWYYGKEPAPLSKIKCDRFLQTITFLTEELTSPGYRAYQPVIQKGLIDILTGMVAAEYSGTGNQARANQSRDTTITNSFKALLLTHFRTIKSPSAYASMLHLSTHYLNQVVKSVSGYTVSYWIQKMIMNEARLLLSTTNNNIKDIAYALGYNDQAYFTRLFSKSQGLSPQAFRMMAQTT